MSDGGSVQITINTDFGLNPSSGVNNLNTFIVSYTGPSAISTLVFNPEGTAATAGNTTGGNNGLDLHQHLLQQCLSGSSFEPITKAFTMGDSVGLGTGDAVAAFSNQAPLAIRRGSVVDDGVVIPE